MFFLLIAAAVVLVCVGAVIGFLLLVAQQDVRTDRGRRDGP
jgi:hypothetical protein